MAEVATAVGMPTRTWTGGFATRSVVGVDTVLTITPGSDHEGGGLNKGVYTWDITRIKDDGSVGQSVVVLLRIPGTDP